ncbi:hypothetical protein G4V62_11350 [Bacillaceae bacterium SIJ1]|uniref:hypothetical protein n=1 Tax=Litoribacterium kuwaitense TaxID=1398745 RepID=UPI0013ED5E72|nr:hypothetical protein [Litoribacterium kuwaitense]NGP45523.1 hypothetical protein [Litoribacterium kuwaitense]
MMISREKKVEELERLWRERQNAPIPQEAYDAIEEGDSAFTAYAKGKEALGQDTGILASLKEGLEYHHGVSVEDQHHSNPESTDVKADIRRTTVKADEQHRLYNERESKNGQLPSYCKKCQKETPTQFMSPKLQILLLGFIAAAIVYSLLQQFGVHMLTASLLSIVVGLTVAMIQFKRLRKPVCTECSFYKTSS